MVDDNTCFCKQILNDNVMTQNSNPFEFKLIIATVEDERKLRKRTRMKTEWKENVKRGCKRIPHSKNLALFEVVEYQPREDSAVAKKLICWNCEGIRGRKQSRRIGRVCYYEGEKKRGKNSGCSSVKEF